MKSTVFVCGLVAGMLFGSASALAQGSVPACMADTGCPSPPPNSEFVSIGTVFRDQRPQYFVIQCGESQVRISLESGHVKFGAGCEPNEAAMRFWDAVTRIGGPVRK